MIRTGFLFATAALLSACGEEPDVQAGDDSRRAEGEVLGGSISDAMIPLDSLTSQSPALKITNTPSGASGDEPITVGAENATVPEEEEGDATAEDGRADEAQGAAPPAPQPEG